MRTQRNHNCGAEFVFRRLDDLIAVNILAVLAAIIAVTGLNQSRWLTVFGLGLALALPGYALSMAALPNLRHAERLLCSFGFSIVVIVLGGLFLNLTSWGLQPISWSLWLGGITLVTSIFAAFQRRKKIVSMPPKWPQIDKKTFAGFALAVAILVGARSAALYGAQQSDERFTQLWALPIATAESLALDIGVNNQENQFESYSLIVQSNGRSVAEWHDIGLNPDDEWRTQLILPTIPDSPIQVLLVRVKEPSEIYRLVQISPATWEAISNSSAGVP